MSICGISCGIFREEIEYLQKNGKIDINFTFFNSLLHMKPELLDITVNQLVGIGKGNFDKFVLIVGDCSPGMLDISGTENMQRPKCINCVEIILGTQRYKKLRKEGAFFLMPEWAERWEEIFKKDLGFNEKVAKMIMNDLHTKLVYIDTGLREIKYDMLENISDYTGLKYEILIPGLEVLEKKINNMVENLRESSIQ